MELLDWSGRQVRPGKRGSVARKVPPNLPWHGDTSFGGMYSFDPEERAVAATQIEPPRLGL